MDDQHHAPSSPEASSDEDTLRTHIRKLILMKETGPKSAAWHRARIRTIWRLQRQAAQASQSDSAQPPQASESNSDDASDKASS